METGFMTYIKATRVRVKTIFLIVIPFLMLTNCNNSPTTEQWESIKSKQRLDMTVLFASQNLNNSFCDSAITYLSDTSLHLMSYDMFLKDSIDFKKNTVVVYPYSEYGCVSLPPYQDRVAFRIHIKEKDSIIINDKISNLEKIENELIKFILNKENIDSFPPKKTITYDENWGEIEMTQAVVEIYCDIYGAGNIQDNLMRVTKVFKIIFDAYDSIRKQRSREVFETNFDKLSPKEKDIIRTMNPLKLYLKPNVFLHYYPYFFEPPPRLPSWLEDLIINDDDNLKIKE